jgi:hypothetical protein
MVARERVSITIEPGEFDSVVLRREGVAVGVLTGAPPPSPEPWVPPPLPPPATALTVALVEAPIERILGRPIETLEVIEREPLDVPLAERASPETTVLIMIQGTNLVDFDDEALGRQLEAAAQVGADVVIRLSGDG